MSAMVCYGLGSDLGYQALGMVCPLFFSGVLGAELEQYPGLAAMYIISNLKPSPYTLKLAVFSLSVVVGFRGQSKVKPWKESLLDLAAGRCRSNQSLPWQLPFRRTRTTNISQISAEIDVSSV